MPRYSSIVMDHFLTPRNSGRLNRPNATGIAGTPGAGPYFVFEFSINGELVSRVAFQTYGCGAAIAAASMLTTLIEGLAVDRCLQLSADDLLAALGGLPAEKTHCASMAIQAMHDGLSATASENGVSNHVS